METLEPTRETFTVSFTYDYMVIHVTVERPESDSTDDAILAAWNILTEHYGIDIEPNDTDVDCWGAAE